MDDNGHSSFAGRARGMAAAARTHPGKVRSVNQDRFVCDPEKGLFAVVDGMGGAQAGEIAAQLTRRVLLENRGELPAAFDRANEAVYRRAAQKAEERGMGCVATAARVEGEDLVLAHVGDTRALLASRAGCEQLTRDHTVVADIEEQEGYTEEQADQLGGRHQVTRDIGGRLYEDLSWIDHGRTRFEEGDLLLLCSDGLSDLVNDGELFSLLGRARKENRGVRKLVDGLIELALTRGAHDNVTVVAVRREKIVDPLPRTDDDVPFEAPTTKAAVTKSAGAGSPSTEMVPTSIVMGPSASWFKKLAAVGVRVVAGLLVAAAGYGLFLFLERWSMGLIGKSGIVTAANRGDRIVAAGPAGLDGVLARNAELTALGSLDVETTAVQTRLAAGADVVLRAARLVFPDEEEAAWEIRVGDGARLRLLQVSIRAPKLRVAIAFEGESGAVVFDDCHLEIRALEAQGPATARIEATGGSLHLQEGKSGLRIAGPRFSGAVRPWPPPSSPPPAEESSP